MAKVRQLYPPLAKVSGARQRIALALPNAMSRDLHTLLLDVASTGNVPLDTAANIGRRAAQTLATEMVLRPGFAYLHAGQMLRLTMPQSEALSVLAWMLSSPAASQPTHPLRPLLDTLHQLLT